jgi:endonuclease YncB( thermonuclease family)
MHLRYLNPFRYWRTSKSNKRARFPWFGKKKDTELEMAVYEEVQPFIPSITQGKVVRVYDGDTITIATRINLDGRPSAKLYRFNVRLRGIDAPEMRSQNHAEKLLAIEARDALHGIVMGQIVSLEGTSYDKYGRLLADVRTPTGLNAGQWMIEQGYAVNYDGGKKYIPNEWTDISLH